MHDYYYYQEAVKKAGLGLVLISVAAAVLSFVLAERVTPDYQVHFSYLVSLTDRELSDDFRYDGYYALSATDLYTATLASWINTPEVIAAAFERSGVAIVSTEPKVLTKTVAANKTGPQLVEIIVRNKDKEAALLLAHGLQAVMKDNVEKYYEEGIPALKFKVVPTEPWVGVNQVASQVIVVSTFVLVLFSGVNIVLLKASLVKAERDYAVNKDREL